uniref:Uncharacterized protein n=1 Tax=Anguilla anguilla TaxID=7936 RepID=A0A0E9XJB9_ANGAN
MRPRGYLLSQPTDAELQSFPRAHQLLTVTRLIHLHSHQNFTYI